MLFSSISFLYCFLPAVLILYYIAPGILKNAVLLAASLLFYAWGEPIYVALMVLSIAIGYVFGLLLEKFRETRKAIEEAKRKYAGGENDLINKLQSLYQSLSVY